MSGSETVQCPICHKYNAKNAMSASSDSTPEFSCVWCGTYQIDGRLARTPQIDDAFRPFLSIAARQAHDKGQPIRFDSTNLKQLADSHRLSISERVDNTLLYFVKKSTQPSHVISVDSAYEYPAVGATSPWELDHYVSYLERQGLVESLEGGGLVVTVPGFLKAEPRLVGGETPGKCFVAMWFDSSMQASYDEGFAPGIRDAAYTPFRVDESATNKGISDTVLSQIRLAEFVVADFTGQRQSVYFEAGFARGLGREGIWCCRANDMANVHFDIKHLGHVVWNDPADLRKKLAESIRANIIRAVPSARSTG